MPYNLVAGGFHTKKLCSRLSSNEVQFLIENGSLAGLAATYDVHLRLIVKRLVDFLLLLIELFR